MASFSTANPFSFGATPQKTIQPVKPGEAQPFGLGAQKAAGGGLPSGWVDASNYLAQTDNNFNAESGASNTSSPDVSLPVWARDGWAPSLGYTGGPTSKYVEGYGNPESGAYAPSSTADSDEWTKFVADKGLKLGAQDAGGNNAALQYFDPSGSAVGARQTNMVDASPDFMRDALGMAAAFAGGTYLAGAGGAANGAQEAFRASELAAQSAGAGELGGLSSGLGYEAMPMPGGENFGFANVGADAGAQAAAEPLAFNAAADSQAANAAMGAAGTPTGAAIAPAGVNLTNAGGVASTTQAPGMFGGLGQAASGGVAALKSALSGVADTVPGGAGLLNGAGAALGAGLVGKALTGSAPASPNASALAAQQAAANLTSAQQTAQINRVDTTTPFGFQKFGQVADPSVPGGIRYTSEIGLSPEQQKLYNAETSNQIASQGIANGMQQRVADSVANPLDLSAAGTAEKALSGDAFSADRDKVSQALFERLTSLRKPQMDRDKSALDTQLRNQGLMPGTEAYDNGMRSMLQAQNTELSDSADRALLAGGAEQTRLQTDARANAGLNNQVRSQTIQEQLLKRQQPLAEYNSFRTGNSPTLPTFQPFGLASVAPTSTTAAAQTAYGSAADSYNARIAALQSALNFGSTVAKGG